MRLWRHLAYKSWLHVSPQAALGNVNLMITTIFISLWDTLNIWNNHARLRRSVRNKNDNSAYLCFISPNDSGWKPCDSHNFTLWDIQMILSRVIHEVVYAEFSETPNPAYFYAYFCFCTRKISFRGFSFTLYCHRTSKLNFKDVPRTSEISFVRRNRYPRCPKNCQKARPLLTSCMMFAPPTYWKFATCVDWALRTSRFPLAGVLLASVSSVSAPFWWLRNHCVYLSCWVD